MFLAHKHLSILNENKIYKTDSFTYNIRDKVVNFINEPLSGWIIKSRDFFKKKKVDTDFFLVHPFDNSIRILFKNFHIQLQNLTIVDSVIQNKVIITIDKGEVFLAIENTHEYQLALIQFNIELSNDTFKPKDLNPGDLVVLSNPGFYKVKEAIYLDSFYTSSFLNISGYSNNRITISKSPNLLHYFLFKNSYGATTVLALKNLKNLKIIGSVDNFIYEDFKLLLFSSHLKFKTKSLQQFNSKKYIPDSFYRYPILSKSKNNPIFFNEKNLVDDFLKIYYKDFYNKYIDTPNFFGYNFEDKSLSVLQINSEFND